MLADEENQTSSVIHLKNPDLDNNEIDKEDLIQKQTENIATNDSSHENLNQSHMMNISENSESSETKIQIPVENNSEDENKIIEVYHAAVDELENLSSTSDEDAIIVEYPVDDTLNTHDDKDAKKEKQKQKLFDVMFERFKKQMERYEPLDVIVKSRIRGGLRVIHDGVPMFLPASHAYLKRNPSEDEMQNLLGKKVRVLLHELHEDDSGRKTIVVSRRHLLEDELWEHINVGDIVEGRISSVANFGVFVDIGGTEGLIHISRLSQIRIDDPKKIFKKGQLIKAVIIELDKEKNRIALSRKELEESPWKDIEAQFPADSIHEGIVRRFSNFGAFVELKPGVDGLLRNTELSWTKRIKHPDEILKIDEKISVKILSVSEEKESITLSYKHTLENPWQTLNDSYPVGSKYKGKIMQIIPQGVIVELDNNLDGFMPRSKLKPLLKGDKIPFKKGDTLNVIIEELIPEQESLILAPFIDVDVSASDKRTSMKKKSGTKKDKDNKSNTDTGSFTLIDLLTDSQKDSLLDSMTE